MRLQFEIKDGPDGVTVRAFRPPNRRLALFWLSLPLLVAVAVFVLAGEGNRSASFIALLPLVMLFNFVYRNWVGLDAMLRISEGRMVSRQPYSHSREYSYVLSRIDDFDCLPFWYQRPGLYAVAIMIGIVRFRICLLPYLSRRQCHEVIEAIEQYLVREKRRMPGQIPNMN